MERASQYLIPAALVFALSSPAVAKENDPNVDLEHRPQQSVAGAVATVSSEMLERPVALRFEDGRRSDDAAIIGSRTDDDDRQTDLRATSDVPEYVRESFLKIAGGWGLDFDPGASLNLSVRLIELNILETNQAVGAIYKAVVRLAYSLSKGDGEPLVSDTAFGDASRYGKKFSNENCNEVLSDALLEAFADLVNDRQLQRAWDD